ncbi:MAG: hypothetical protein M1813_003173 [Trichoglossum hirsutum]|nr:MAG: hypothetical protein M1813_003173 [Trichoglossum hirsutum]
MALLKANQAKLAAWREDSSRYEQAKKAQPDITFIDWMTKNAVAYNNAWKEEDELLQGFENLSDIPCVSVDEDFTKSPGAAVNTKDMYYQPLHALSNCEISVDKWIKMYKKGVFTGDFDLDFQSAKPIAWAQFGHPALDEGTPSPSPEHDAVYNALEAKI